MKSVSVIIPVYNAEKYLADCIASLLQQTLSDCEFIFINDGSTDHSQAIIETFQKKDPRIVLIQQENQGVSAARNKGIQLATGSYIGFVDADDHIDSTFFETLYHAAQADNIDIVCSNFITEQDGENLKSKAPFCEAIVYEQSFIQNEIIPFFIKDSGLNNCWTKLFKSELLKKNNLMFPVGVALGEDGIFVFQTFFYARNLIFLNYYGYFYREVSGSATRNIIEKDYFKSALDSYYYNYYDLVPLALSPELVTKLKTLLLMRNVMATIGIYLKPNKEVSFFSRYQYVKQMICHPLVQNGIRQYEKELQIDGGPFQNFIISCIKHKMTLLIVLANGYSQIRNKK